MITVAQYFGEFLDHPDALEVRKEAAATLLERVNALLFAYEASDRKVPINPHTGTQVSGVEFGGFRPQSCPQGAPHSSHKEGGGVDVYDPQNRLDDWLNDDILAAFDLYREHPDSTQGWCHLTTRRPPSGHRTFLP